MGALERVKLADVAASVCAPSRAACASGLGSPRSLMKGAEIAILDEPTSGLDPQATVDFLGLIEQLKHEDITVLLSSHLLDQVQRVCDRVALFQTGRIVLLGSVPQLAKEVLGAGFIVEVDAVAPPGPISRPACSPFRASLLCSAPAIAIA